MISEKITSNEINLTFIPVSKSDLLNEIENIFKKYLTNEQKKVYLNLEEFAEELGITRDLLRKKIKKGIIPEYLISEYIENDILFYNHKVLEWFSNHCPTKAIE